MRFKLSRAALVREAMLLLDKIAYRNALQYIGVYYYSFKTAENTYSVEVVFSATEDAVHAITIQKDLTLGDSTINIHGMLDVDGCGEDEMLIEKTYSSEDEEIIYFEIYKQIADSNWMQIKTIKTRRQL